MLGYVFFVFYLMKTMRIYGVSDLNFSFYILVFIMFVSLSSIVKLGIFNLKFSLVFFFLVLKSKPPTLW